ncbi:MAG: ribonuclease III [Acidimicrobiia bacterium]|nr:ribonuclease III [Acidimicrobiia bacterium]
MPAETHSSREVDIDDLERIVVECAAEVFDDDSVTIATELPDDAVAVADLVEIVGEEVAERALSHDLSDEAGEWQTLGDLVDAVTGLLARDSETAGTGPDSGAGGLTVLEDAIGHRFADRALLEQALQHRSYVAENDGTRSNERLEFLGDAVLGVVVTDELYRTWSEAPEGTLAKARAAIVSSENLAEQSAQYGLGDHLALGKGEHQSGGREKPSILADAMEALIGAVYLDGGMDAARRFVLEAVGAGLEDAVTGEGSKDYKTRLQELSAQVLSKLPVYSVEARGPDHAKEFEAEVALDGEVAGRGWGRSKKQAEQAAARAAWETHSGALLERHPGRQTSHSPDREQDQEGTDA